MNKNIDNIKKIAKIDKKFNAFKRLLAYAVTTIASASPLIVTTGVVLTTGIDNGFPFFLSFIASVFTGYISIAMSNHNKNGYSRYINSDYWKYILNLPASESIKKQEFQLIKVLKEDLSPQDLVRLYIQFMLDFTEISSWYIQNLKESNFEYKEYTVSETLNTIRLKDGYSYMKKMARGDKDNNSFNINTITATLNNKIAQIDATHLAALMKEVIAEKYSEINIEGLSSKILETVLYSGGYKELKKEDYNTIAKLMKNGELSFLSVFQSASQKGSCYVDWYKIKEIMDNNYKEIDSMYHRWNEEIKKNIENQKNQPEIQNLDIIKKIQENRDTSSQSEKKSIDLINLNSILYYNPYLHSQLWAQLVNNCKNIEANKNSLNQQDIINFNEKIENIIPNIIMSDNYIKNLKSETKGAIIIKEEMSNNLQEMIAISQIIIDSMESNVIKTLTVDKKYLKMRNS